MKYSITAGLIIFLLVSANGQKVKYKDIFPLLSPTQTEQGLTTLKIYLSDEKNKEVANAIFQLGLYYLDLHQKQDILSPQKELIAYGDSSILLLRLSIDLIDEKELKKNDTYYQSYYRRDLRTGEFGISLSDVHLDIEKRIESIEMRNLKTQQIRELLGSMKSTTTSSISLYNQLNERYTDYPNFILNMNEQIVKEVRVLSDFQNELVAKADEVAALCSSLGQAGRIEPITFIVILGLKNVENIFETSSNQPQFYDFDSWSDKTINLLRNEVKVLKSELIKWDQKLNLVQERVKSGNGSNIELEPSAAVALLIDKYDSQSEMLTFLRIKSRKVLLDMLESPSIQINWSDSSLVKANEMMVDSVVIVRRELQGLLEETNQLLGEEDHPYQDHIDQLYGGASAIQMHIDQWKKELVDSEGRWSTLQQYWYQRNSWVAYEADSIAIKEEFATAGDRYRTKIIEDKGDSLLVLGLDLQEKKTFVAFVHPDRTVNWLRLINQDLMTTDTVAVELMEAAPSMIMFYTYVGSEDQKGQSIFTKVDGKGNLLWSSATELAKKPDHFAWNSTLDQYTVYLFPDDAYPLADGSKGFITIDANGAIQ